MLLESVCSGPWATGWKDPYGYYWGHEEQWDLDYANHSYFRIRHLDTGEVRRSRACHTLAAEQAVHTTGCARTHPLANGAHYWLRKDASVPRPRGRCTMLTPWGLPFLGVALARRATTPKVACRGV